LRQQTEYSIDEDFVFASPTLEGKRLLWGQTTNANFVKPAALTEVQRSEAEIDPGALGLDDAFLFCGYEAHRFS
jgi:hypothetical protein